MKHAFSFVILPVLVACGVRGGPTPYVEEPEIRQEAQKPVVAPQNTRTKPSKKKKSRVK